MKTVKILSLMVAILVGLVTACKDDSIQIIPEWETGVTGFGTFVAGTPTNFVFQDDASALDVNLKWISADQKNSVTKIDVYLTFDEPYVDPDGNPATARHATANGVLLTSFSGATVPKNRENIKFTITQPQLYELFKDKTFDYDEDGTATPVFNNPAVPERSPSVPFVKGDAFQIRWEFTTDDGRKFYKWGVSVCTELPGSNCQVSWGVICPSDLVGTYNVVSTFVSPDYGFSSANPDYQYCPAGDHSSISGGVQTHNGVEVEADPDGKAATYHIADLTNGFEPAMWCNPPVDATVADQCGNLVLVSYKFGYKYFIMPGSVVNPDGSLTIKWQNEYGENGVSTYTPVD